MCFVILHYILGEILVGSQQRVVDLFFSFVSNVLFIFFKSKWTCCVKLVSFFVEFTQALFIFTVPPKILSLSRDIVVNEGSNITLMCQASGKPEPSISWKLISSGNLFYKLTDQMYSHFEISSNCMSSIILFAFSPLPSWYHPIFDFFWLLENLSVY